MASTLKQRATAPSDSDGVVQSKRKRVQIDFSPEAFARLEGVRQASDAASNAELVRSALRLFEWFIRQRAEGFEVRLVKGDEERSVELMW